jgi:hypothetical protein
MPQIITNDLDIKGVGKLNEWDAIATAVDSIRKDFAFSDNKRHRKRQAERGIDAGILQPLIGDTILDTRKAQDASDIIDWGKSKSRAGRERRRIASTTREYVKYHTTSATRKFYTSQSTASKTRATAQTGCESAHTTAARPNSTERRVWHEVRQHAPQNTKHLTEHTLTNTYRTASFIHRSQKCYVPRLRRGITTDRTKPCRSSEAERNQYK